MSNNGRKYRMGLLLLMAAIAGFIAIMVVPTVGPYYATFLGGLCGIYTIYCGGNIGTHLAYTRPTVQVVKDRRQTERKEDMQPSKQPQQNGPGPSETGGYLQGVP